jgi:LPXTG-site transpeptidase (sortase) family protein
MINAHLTTGKRFLRGALTLLALGGATMAVWPVGQTAYTHWNQQQLQREWQRAAAQPVSAQPVSAAKNLSAEQSSTRSGKLTKRRIEPLPPTRLIIPDIGVDAVVVQGEDDASLERGPGHAPYTALPGQPGNCVIAAHRNLHGSYFYRVDELLPGAKITLRTPHQSYTYQVIQMYQVADTDAATVKALPPPGSPPILTIYTCTLPRSTNRIVITSQLMTEEQKAGENGQ